MRKYVLILLLLLAGCTASPQPANFQLNPDGSIITATPDSAELYAKAVAAQRALDMAQAQAANAQATADSYNGRMTATSAASAAQSTQQAWDLAAHQTQQAWQATATAAAIADAQTATAASVYASQTATADAWQRQSTQQAYDRQATADVAAIMAQQTQQAIIAESNRLALEREKSVNQVRAIAPWVIIALTFILLLAMVVLFATAQARRPQIIQRDLRGDAPILFDGHNIIDPDRVPGPIISTGRLPAVPPNTADPAVTQRDQAIDALHRGLPGAPRPPRSSGESQLTQIAPVSTPFRIYTSSERPALPEDTQTILDAEWKELEP